MFPSVAPTVALYSRMTKARSPLAPLLFTGGYLLAWAAPALLAFAIAAAGGRSHGRRARLGPRRPMGRRARRSWWPRVYELTPLKDVCLGKCRSPLGFLLGSWRDGRVGALRMGAGHGAWCVGCCWALMASLFALGVMSIAWMAFVAGLIAVEKTLPWRRVATVRARRRSCSRSACSCSRPRAPSRPHDPGQRPDAGHEWDGHGPGWIWTCRA